MVAWQFSSRAEVGPEDLVRATNPVLCEVKRSELDRALRYALDIVY
jgi:hypothetical protein